MLLELDEGYLFHQLDLDEQRIDQQRPRHDTEFDNEHQLIVVFLKYGQLSLLLCVELYDVMMILIFLLVSLCHLMIVSLRVSVVVLGQLRVEEVVDTVLLPCLLQDVGEEQIFVDLFLCPVW